MRITNVDVEVLFWPVHDPPHWMSLAPGSTSTELIVRVHSDAGITGIGHVDAGGIYRIDDNGDKRPAGAALVAREDNRVRYQEILKCLGVVVCPARRDESGTHRYPPGTLKSIGA